MDRLYLRGMEFYGRHGRKPAERELGQRFRVDVELAADLRPAGSTDDLARTVNYPEAYRAVQEIVEGDPVDLLETVAERIAARLLQYPPVQEATVRVWKRPPLAGTFAAFGVEVVRGK